MPGFSESLPVLDYARGEGMKQEVNEDVYRAAFESATTELGEISTTFEQLRIRKDRIEKLVTVLKALVEAKEKAETSDEDSPPEKVQQAGEQGSSDESEELMADPFQRRIDHVLGIGAGIRDVRKYTRQF